MSQVQVLPRPLHGKSPFMETISPTEIVVYLYESAMKVQVYFLMIVTALLTRSGECQTWQNISHVGFTHVQQPAVCSYEGNIYLYGCSGTNGNYYAYSLQCYNPATDSWSTVLQNDTTAYDFSKGDKMVLAGSKWYLFHADLTILCLDLTTPQKGFTPVTTTGKYPYRRFSAVNVLGDTIYFVAGEIPPPPGYDNDVNDGFNSCTNVFGLNLLTHSWFQIPDKAYQEAVLPPEVSHHYSYRYNDKIVVLGGSDVQGCIVSPFTKVGLLDPVSKVVQIMESPLTDILMPLSMYYEYQYCATDGRFAYIIPDTYLDTLLIYDPAFNKGMKIQATNGVSRREAAFICLDHKLYVFSGVSSSRGYSEIPNQVLDTREINSVAADDHQTTMMTFDGRRLRIAVEPGASASIVVTDLLGRVRYSSDNLSSAYSLELPPHEVFVAALSVKAADGSLARTVRTVCSY